MLTQKGKVSLSTLGSNGRFGNQIFQYAFLRIYAKHYNLDFETPHWIGEYLFGHNDTRISSNLPLVKEEEIFLSSEYNLIEESNGLRNVDLYGYFLYHTKFYNRYKDFFISLFQPQLNIVNQIQSSLDTLKKQGKTIVGIHIRRGDYFTLTYSNYSMKNGKSPYFFAPCKWYIQYLEEIWGTLNNPVLFIASDEPDKILNDFKVFSPITSKHFSVYIPQAEFYPDFYFLSQCDILAISNSTFSFLASMLNQKCKTFARPDLSNHKLISFDPWDSYPLLYCHTKFYPTSVARNLYFLAKFKIKNLIKS